MNVFEKVKTISIVSIIKKLIFAGIIFSLIHVLILLTIGLFSNTTPADAIVVFGNKVEENGQPSKRLQSRLDRGVELFRSEYAPVVVVSGGIGKEGFDEAVVMKDYLVEQGVSDEYIIIDSQGNTTYDTLRNIVVDKDETSIHSVILVSQYYHLLRAKMAAEKFGLEVHGVSAADMFPELRDLYSIPREMVGYYVYFFKDYGVE